ncbi:hypothetical protein NPIL_539851 [Nephila pilipes]|uniref:Uncharacterized protein n=1 Tax=Nephila pilipes TaxID=299642 RepID=A0A8X6PVF8_NEPPI|nr:hypothetical protein NPIL_539851 [Nephila pilipes]
MQTYTTHYTQGNTKKIKTKRRQMEKRRRWEIHEVQDFPLEVKDLPRKSGHGKIDECKKGDNIAQAPNHDHLRIPEGDRGQKTDR